MRTETMVPIAPTIDAAGFKMVDVASPSLFETCVRFLHEDPWERLRLLRQLMPKTPLTTLVRGRNLFAWARYPNDVVELCMQCLKKAGIDCVQPYDTLHDFRNLEWPIHVAKEVGLRVAGCLGFISSPVHTDAYWAGKASEYLALGADAVYVEDGSGLLTPERARTLIPALREAVGTAELQLHLHCCTGLAEEVSREAIRLGIDCMHTVSLPLANGASNMATIDVLNRAQELGMDAAPDRQRVREIDDYFFWAAYQQKQSIEPPLEFDLPAYQKYAEHQVPGGMVSHLVSQLSQLGLVHRLPQILEEVARLRQELGYPGMFTPFSQIICVQALVNVLEGERYRTVSRELSLYARGYYGKPPAPIDPNVLDRIVRDEKPLDPSEMFLEPLADKVRSQEGPFSSDEELLLSIWYGRAALEKHREGKKTLQRHSAVGTPLAALIMELGKRRDINVVSLEKGPLRLRYVAGPEG
ncbi:MAG: hypothetical protein KGJ86_07080 [Chloroflexota bacterium]|nr:hypothetical protein [Chloroflexota bacterium]